MGVWLWNHKDSRIHLTSLRVWNHYESTKSKGETMAEKVRLSPFPLRLLGDIRVEVQVQASKNRRSLNAELGILIEQGLKWRATQGEKTVA